MSNYNFTNFQEFIFTSPSKAHAVAQKPGGVYIGTLTSVGSTTCFVEIPSVVPGFSFGPCRVALSPWPHNKRGDKWYTEKETEGGYPEHDHENAFIGEVGDQVICAFINNKLDEVVVIGRLL